VERLAGKLAEILKGPRCARDVRHDDDQPWEGRTPPRKQSRTRQRLVMQFKPCGAYMRTHQATTTGGVTTRILNQLESHPTTRQHHRDLADHLRGRRDERGRERPCPFAGRYGAPSIKSKASTQSIPSCAVWRRSRRKGSRWTKPETANRTIFKTRKEGPHQADAWPLTQSRYSHRRPQTHQGDRRAALPCPGRPQAGTNTAPTRRRAMLALIILGTAGRSRLVQTGNGSDQPHPPMAP
jgi:hypothetical protein